MKVKSHMGSEHVLLRDCWFVFSHLVHMLTPLCTYMCVSVLFHSNNTVYENIEQILPKPLHGHVIGLI